MKWLTFELLNRIADKSWQGEVNPSIHAPVLPANSKKNPIWIFCSTIGELNACFPLFKSLEKAGQLVFLTDHNCYRKSYQDHFPHAYVVELTGRVTDARILVKRLSPALFILCEIPAMPSDAPCRLSYGLLREARKAGASVHLVNGWLYGYAPACRMDRLEVLLFRQEYLNSFDTLSVQNEEIKTRLLEAGAREERISITGNMKFDSIGNVDAKWVDPVSKGILGFLSTDDFSVVVAGCLANIDECYSLFSAIAQIQKTIPDCRFVVAPRHPENTSFMKAFTQRLDDLRLPYQFKSKLTTDQFKDDAILILDTFGELKDFYSAATVCYVGCNHNVLEPLSFGKVTIVSGEWNPLYPSYPVYQLTREKGLIQHVEEVTGITNAILDNLSEDESKKDRSKKILNQLHSLSGAVDRTLETLNLQCTL